MGGEREDPAACAREDAHVCPITTRHRLGSFFFTASGNQTRLSLAPESLSSGVFPSAFEAAAAIAATGHLPLRPPPSSAVRSAGSRFQKQRGKPTSNGDLVDLQVLRETAVPSSCRRRSRQRESSWKTRLKILKLARTSSAAGQENVFSAGQLFPERSKRSFIVQHPSYQCFQTRKLHRSQKSHRFDIFGLFHAHTHILEVRPL